MKLLTLRIDEGRRVTITGEYESDQELLEDLRKAGTIQIVPPRSEDPANGHATRRAPAARAPKTTRRKRGELLPTTGRVKCPKCGELKDPRGLASHLRGLEHRDTPAARSDGPRVCATCGIRLRKDTTTWVGDKPYCATHAEALS